MKLRYPVFYDVEQRSLQYGLADSGTRLRIEINIGGISNSMSVELQPPTMTVGELKGKLFDAFNGKRRVGDPALHPKGPSHCIFKMTGFEDYLLRDDVPVLKHENVWRALVAERSCCLNLVLLKEAEFRDLVRYRRMFSKWVSPCPPMGPEDDEPCDIPFALPKVLDDSKAPKISDCMDFTALEYICAKDCNWPFRVRVRALELTDTFLQQEIYFWLSDPTNVEKVWVEVSLYINGERLVDNCHQPVVLSTAWWHQGGIRPQKADPRDAKYVPFAEQLNWPDVWLTATRVQLSSLPPETRISCCLFGLTNYGAELKIATVSTNLFDFRGHMQSGTTELHMWPWPTSRRLKRDDSCSLPSVNNGPTADNYASSIAPILYLEFDSFEQPVVAGSPTMSDAQAVTKKMVQAKKLKSPSPSRQKTFSTKARALVEEIKVNPLYQLSIHDRRTLWNARASLSMSGALSRRIAITLLPKLLQATDGSNVEELWEARRIMFSTNIIGVETRVHIALELLGEKSSDRVVRAFATRLLSCLSDSVLSKFMLQLVQAMKFDKDLDSALVRMLLRRALHSPMVIGHPLFWLLRAEMHNADVCDKYSLVLEMYVRNCSEYHRHSLKDQSDTNRIFQDVAEHAAQLKGDRTNKVFQEMRNKFARNELRKLVSQ